MKKRDFEKRNPDVVSMETAIKKIAKARGVSQSEAKRIFFEAIRSGEIEAMTVDPMTGKRTAIPSVQ
jgi:hypothetical protein